MSLRTNSLTECIRDLTPLSPADAAESDAREVAGRAVLEALGEIDRIAEVTWHQSTVAQVHPNAAITNQTIVMLAATTVARNTAACAGMSPVILSGGVSIRRTGR